MVKVGAIAVDGTKVHANASRDAERRLRSDRAGGPQRGRRSRRRRGRAYGEKRGDELPEHLSTSRAGVAGCARPNASSMRTRERGPAGPAFSPGPLERGKAPSGGGAVGGVTRERAIRALSRACTGQQRSPPRGVTYSLYAARDSRGEGEPRHLEPIVDAAQRELEQAGVSDTPAVLLADAGYWHQRQMENIIDRGIQVLIPPDAGKRKGTRPGWDGGAYAHMRRVLQTDFGRALYRRRQAMIEPVFGHTKFNRRMGSLPTPRKIRRASRVAANHRDPQPLEAPQPPDRGRRALKGPREGPAGPHPSHRRQDHHARRRETHHERPR